MEFTSHRCPYVSRTFSGNPSEDIRALRNVTAKEMEPEFEKLYKEVVLFFISFLIKNDFLLDFFFCSYIGRHSNQRPLGKV